MVEVIRISLVDCYGDIFKKKQENRKGQSSVEGNPSETETKSFSSILNDCCRKEN